MITDRQPATSLEDALMLSYSVDAFHQLYRLALGYRDVARAALATLHAERTRVKSLESQLTNLQAELRQMRRSDAA